jgi:hypothetical protein
LHSTCNTLLLLVVLVAVEMPVAVAGLVDSAQML